MIWHGQAEFDTFGPAANITQNSRSQQWRFVIGPIHFFFDPFGDLLGKNREQVKLKEKPGTIVTSSPE
jgi:hypothetical protein